MRKEKIFIRIERNLKKNGTVYGNKYIQQSSYISIIY